MIARVSLEIALRREFDYAIPPELAGQVDVGSRVQVPFGPRKIPGVVTAMAEESGHANLKSIIKVIGAQTLVTPKVLRLARWIGEYYCCAPEIALKSVLPEAVRGEDAGWRERLFVRPLPLTGEFPKLPRRQQDLWNIIEKRRVFRQKWSKFSQNSARAHLRLVTAQPRTFRPSHKASLYPPVDCSDPSQRRAEPLWARSTDGRSAPCRRRSLASSG